MKTQEQILRFIRRQIPRSHFEDILGVIPVAFSKAHEACQQLVHLPHERKRAQDRYFFLQDGLADLKISWSSQVTPTLPCGEFYTLMQSGNVKVTAAVKPWKRKVRPAQYRRNNSKLNNFLASSQLDFLDDQSVEFGGDESLNAIVIPLAPPPHADQSAPLGTIIAVPYFDSCRDYHVWCDIRRFMEGYESDSYDESDDFVWPVIRQRMRSDEEGRSDGAGGS